MDESALTMAWNYGLRNHVAFMNETTALSRDFLWIRNHVEISMKLPVSVFIQLLSHPFFAILRLNRCMVLCDFLDAPHGHD